MLEILKLPLSVLSSLPRLAHDFPVYMDLIVGTLNGTGYDDRKFLLEKVLVLISHAEKGSVFARILEELFIRLLYRDLSHPAMGYLGIPEGVPSPIPAEVRNNPMPYAFRTADGSNYNVHMPTLGMAGLPYVRTVTGSNTFLQHRTYPPAEVIFDELLKRDEFVEHPGGLSSFFFSFANIIIHDLWNTNARDWMKNDASSYVDLSPLYGSTEADVNSVRRHDGTGRLWEDVFADKRLLFMTPSTCALLVIFCRNHNYVATRIYTENENGTYVDPATLDDEKRVVQDAELFHRARLVNAAFYAQIVLGDYVGSILGLTRDGFDWRLDLPESMRELSHSWTPRGEGNVVSVEFNLMYRWHPAISQEDNTWMDHFFDGLFHGKPMSELTIEDYKQAVRELAAETPKDVRARTFHHLKRGPDGRFADADIARLLLDATESPAAAFKARGIPAALRIVEVMGITQARKWRVCTLNEFRAYFGMRKYKDFNEWNPDPKIYTAAKRLYGHIDNLELYVGLQAEESKPPMPGAGLCPGYTISRGILADAVALTRGDRFLTFDFTPSNLTAWGYQDCQYDKEDGSMGGIIGRMLGRTLPGYYPDDSAYKNFPFMVPKTMKGYMSKQRNGDVSRYSWDRPKGPLHEMKKAAMSLSAVKAKARAQARMHPNANGSENGEYAQYGKLGH